MDFHPFQVNADYLTKAVAKVIDASGAFNGYAEEEKPSLHELRSFGAHLYEEAGYPKKYIQALLGHANAKMTEHYLDGHG
jgi:integrase